MTNTAENITSYTLGSADVQELSVAAKNSFYNTAIDNVRSTSLINIDSIAILILAILSILIINILILILS